MGGWVGGWVGGCWYSGWVGGWVGGCVRGGLVVITCRSSLAAQQRLSNSGPFLNCPGAGRSQVASTAQGLAGGGKMVG